MPCVSLRTLVSFSLVAVCVFTAMADDAKENSGEQPIVGSTDRTAAKGYSHQETI